MNLRPRYEGAAMLARRYLDCDGHAQDMLARGSVSVPTPSVRVAYLGVVGEDVYRYSASINGIVVSFATNVALGMPVPGYAWRRVVLDVVVTPARYMEDDSAVSWRVLAVQENAGSLGLVDTIPEDDR